MKADIHPKYHGCGNSLRVREHDQDPFHQARRSSSAFATFAIRSILDSRSSWIPPVAWTSSNSAWPRRRPPRPLPPSKKKKRSSAFSRQPPALRVIARVAGGCVFIVQSVIFAPQVDLLMDLRPYIEKFARRFAEVETALSDPKLFDNPANARRSCPANIRGSRISLRPANAYLKVIGRSGNKSRAGEHRTGDSEMAQMAKEEIARAGSGRSEAAQGSCSWACSA